jgi:hypothetical protein
MYGLTEETSSRKETKKYGLVFPSDDHVWIERQFIRHGGTITIGKNTYGRGLAYHVMEMQKLLWPDKQWHRWNRLVVENVCSHRFTGILGAASTGKTHEAALLTLCFYFAFPTGFTGLVSSTDSRSLELRVWGEIKKYWQMAKEVWEDCPGHLVESKQQIVTSDDGAGRDNRDGIIGVPTVVGGQYVGLGKFVGIKNKHMLLVADELSFMGKALVDAISNLNKNKGFRLIGLGNPKDPTDALGLVCEPHPDLGGWPGIDQGEKTKVWKTRWRNGCAIQLPGTDSPNFDVADGEKEPYPFLIGREEIRTDLEYYGRDSLQFGMMDLGIMPATGASRRVIDAMLCDNNMARDKAVWRGRETTLIAGLDASYSSFGDRTALVILRIGRDLNGVWIMALDEKPIIVPISAKAPIPPQEQVARAVKNMCMARGISADRLYVDSTGHGALMSAFAREWSANVVPVEFGGKPSDRPVSDVIPVESHKHYGKFVSELWFFIRHVIEAKQFRQITDELVEEGSLREWFMNKGGKIDVEAKAEMKKRAGKSPDLFDALVLAAEGARRHGFEITKTATYSDLDREEADLFYLQLMEKKQGLHKNKRLIYS